MHTHKKGDSKTHITWQERSIKRNWAEVFKIRTSKVTTRESSKSKLWIWMAPDFGGRGAKERRKKKAGWGRRRVLKILIWIWISMSDGVHIHIWILYPISNENQAVLLYSGPWHKNESSLQRISGEYIWNKGKEVLLCATCGQRGEFAAIEDHRVKKCS